MILVLLAGALVVPLLAAPLFWLGRTRHGIHRMTARS